MSERELSDIEKRIFSEGFSPAVIRDLAKDLGLGTKFIESVESTLKFDPRFLVDPYKKETIFDNDSICDLSLNEIHDLDDRSDYRNDDIENIKSMRRDGLQKLVNVLSEVNEKKKKEIFGKPFPSIPKAKEEASDLVKKIQDKKVERGSDLRMMEIYSIIDDYINEKAQAIAEKKITDLSGSLAEFLRKNVSTVESKIVKKTNFYINEILDSTISEKVEKCVEVKAPAPLIEELINRVSALESKLEAKDALITKLMGESVACLEFNTKIAGVCDGNTKDLNKAFDDIKMIQEDVKSVATKVLSDNESIRELVGKNEKTILNMLNTLREKGVEVGDGDIINKIGDISDRVFDLKDKFDYFHDKIKDYDNVLYCIKEIINIYRASSWKFNEIKTRVDDVLSCV